jgi:predicted site-specific integrase-resolvase
MQSCHRSDKPERIISVHVASRRLGVSRNVLSKYIRRGTIKADFVSDLGSYFRSSALGEIRAVIRKNRAATRKHCSSASTNI